MQKWLFRWHQGGPVTVRQKEVLKKELRFLAVILYPFNLELGLPMAVHGESILRESHYTHYFHVVVVVVVPTLSHV